MKINQSQENIFDQKQLFVERENQKRDNKNNIKIKANFTKRD